MTRVVCGSSKRELMVIGVDAQVAHAESLLHAALEVLLPAWHG